MRQLLLPWLICIILPFLIELITSITIILLWVAIPLYILVIKGSNITNLDLIFFIYFACSWLYAIWNFLKHNIFIPKSLLTFPLYIKDSIRNSKNNKVIFLSAIIIIVVIWQLLNKPEIEVSKLDTVESHIASIAQEINRNIEESKSLESVFAEFITENNKNINSLNNFSRYPQINQLPQDKNSIEILSQEYRNYLGNIQSRKMDIRQKKTSLFRIENSLKNNNNRLIDIENQFKTLCISNNKSQNITVCSSLSKKIGSLKELIKSGLDLLTKSKENLIAIETTMNIPEKDKILAVWEQKIEEILGRFNFNTDDVQNWIIEADNTPNTVKINISTIQKLQQDFLANNHDNYTALIKVFSKELSISGNKITKFEEQSQNSIEVKPLLKTIKDNNNALEKLEKEIINLRKKIDFQYSQIRINLNELIRTKILLKKITVQGYRLSIYARSHSEGKSYIDIINTKKKVIDDLLKEVSLQEKTSNKLMLTIEDKIQEWTWNLDKNIDTSKILKARFNKLNTKLEWIIIRTNIIKFVLVLLVLGILFGFAIYQHRIMLLNNSKQLETNLSKLLLTINNPKEFLQVRLKAIKIVDEQILLTDQDIKKIKNDIRKLENSKNRDDGVVASRLRQVADSLELRLTEQRKKI